MSVYIDSIKWVRKSFFTSRWPNSRERATEVSSWILHTTGRRR